MERVLLIDDMRNISATRVARTYEEGIQALQSDGPWDLVLLDHDLGHLNPDGTADDYRTGYGIICWLEEHPEYLPKAIRPVTSNPVGLQKFRVVLQKLYGQKLYGRS